MAVDDASFLASWLFGLHEQETVIFPQTGHIAVSLPVELRNLIERLASLEDRTMRDWIVERLSDCTQDEQSRATLTAEEDRQRTVEDILQRLRTRECARGPTD